MTQHGERPQNPWQQPGPGWFGPEGYINLTLQGNMLTSNMITPTVLIDGYQVPASYGSNHLRVLAGRHTVSAYTTWIGKHGQASYDVVVQPGQSVPVFYATPVVNFAKGAMGPTKQKRPGKGLFVGVMVLIVLLIVLAVTLPVGNS